MSERDVLLEWLSRASRRLQAQRVTRRGLCVVLGCALLWLFHQLFLVAALPAAVVGALDVLLWLAGGGLVLWGASVLIDATGIEQSAFAADAAGGWHDELKSAFWFGQGVPLRPVEQVLMARAARTATAADMKTLWPWRTQGLLAGIVAVTAVAAGLSWWSPRLHSANPQSESVRAKAGNLPRPESASASRAGDQGLAVTSGQARVRAPGGASPSALASGEDARADVRVDSATVTSTDTAPDSRTARPSADAAESPSAATPVARAERTELAGEWLGSVVARLKDLLEKDGVGVRDSSARASGSAQDPARIGRSERGDNVDRGQSHPDSQMRNADTSSDSDLRMNALGGVGPRNTQAGAGDGEEQSGRTGSSNSGALGRRINSSRAGAGDDDEMPQGDPGGSGPSPEVLGKKTMRLAVQLRRTASPAKSDDDPAPEQAGSAEEFFAATRQQAARAAPNDKARPGGHQSEADVLSTVETPIGYRAAAKAYFLSQHGKEK
ncbi:MAG: hypothetical protein FJY37_06015 [Betaproteobacteria bacterium]|nr:hypothetical protein [Betaproteobacteria bacterium]